MTEVAFVIDWSVWLPITISAVSLFLTIKTMSRRASREKIMDVERKIDRAFDTLKECEDNLRACGREKDELRREKYALLEQVSTLANVQKPIADK